jgi:predicted methyltransferase
MRGIASLLVLLLVLSGGCVIRRAAEPPAPGSEAALAAARAALAREAALALQGEIELAVAHPSRPASDTVRDAGRRPGEVLAFFGIEPGMRVADLMAGSGYYTELLARVVGSEGVVYAQLNRYVLDKLGDDALTARLTKPGLENVVRWNRELDALELPEAELDAVLLILFYHDTYWQKTNREIGRASCRERVLRDV